MIGNSTDKNIFDDSLPVGLYSILNPAPGTL